MGLISFTEDTQPAPLEDKLKWKERADKYKPAAEKSEETAAQSFPKDDGVTSLTFEQVNDNADELVELRGAGRYFGVTDPDTGDSINAQQELGRICDNCHKRGHTRAKCTTVICHKCGIVGDHYESQCPTTIVCSRCGDRGHTWAVCTSKKWKQQYCKACDLYSHSDDTCPSIWRSYLTKTCAADVRLPPSYCYNCGDDLHFGDECPEPRTSRIPNSSGSAFSGNNLPQELRARYFDRCLGKSTSASSSRNFSSNSSSYGSGYNDGYSKNYTSGYSNSHNYSNSYKDEKSSKKRSYESTKSTSSRNYEPSRSGFIASKTSGKKSQTSGKSLQASRSGVLPSKPKGPKGVNPSRSGVLKGKKSGKGSMQQLY